MHEPLTQAEEWLILTLARRVRVFTDKQICGSWFDGDRKKARESIQKLESQDLIKGYTDLIGGVLTLTTPLLTWEPYQGKAPRFSEIAYIARKRWKAEPSRQNLFFATTTAVHRFAGSTNGKPPATNALQHDLQVAALYLHFLKTEPRRTRRWIGEDEWHELGYCGHKQAVPDAVIRHRRDYRKNVLIEMAGQYSPERLEEWHKQYIGFRYEIW